MGLTLTPPPADYVSLVKEEDGERVVCKLENTCFFIWFMGTRFLSIRDYYHIKDGRHLPGAKGVGLMREQWPSLKRNLLAIQKAIDGIHSKFSFLPVTEDLKDMPDSSTSRVSGLVPLVIRRFDGKNYASWAHQTVPFLNQLNIAYVLANPCPTASARADVTSRIAGRSIAAEQNS